MILPDVNVLIAAFRSDASEHRVCLKWLTSVISSDARFALSPLILAAVVRIVTNRRIYANPSTAADAMEFCDSLLDQPHREIVQPGDRHWSIFRRLCVEADIRGALVTDAWYAALAIEWGCEWITLDRDFARFPGLRWATPA